MIAGYILWMSWKGVVPVIRILMLGAPEGTDLHEVIKALGEMRGVDSVHNVHLWRMQEHESGLEAHVVLDGQENAEKVKQAIKTLLRERFGVAHSVLELEELGVQSAEEKIIGH
jgi:cobalt-zinc-cadmium efflux system protein